MNNFTEKYVERTRSKAFAAEGERLNADHVSELRDLALIEAHLDGVTINVEQPLEIGQKVEVHKS